MRLCFSCSKLFHENILGFRGSSSIGMSPMVQSSMKAFYGFIVLQTSMQCRWCGLLWKNGQRFFHRISM